LQSHNAYAYVMNNPVNSVDSTGLFLTMPGQCDASVGACGGGGPGGGDGGGFCDASGNCGTGTGVDGILNGIPGPGYLMQATSPLAELLAAEAQYVAGVKYTIEGNQFLAGFIVQRGPGGVYYNPYLAGAAATQFIDPSSIANNLEYSGNVYMNPDGTYSYTAPSRGGTDWSSFDPSAIPFGTTFAGAYHTHGAFDMEYDNEQFSPAGCNGGKPCDIGWANSFVNQRQPMFLGTPLGRTEVYFPSQAATMPFGCVVVGGPVPVAPGQSSVPVPTCF